MTVTHIDKYRSEKPSYNNSFSTKNDYHISNAVNSNHTGFVNSGGGGNMDNYITRPEFEEHKRHLDSRFDNVQKDIEIAKNSVISKIEETRKADKRWFISLAIGTGVTFLGVLFNAIGLMLKVFGVI